MPSSRRLKVTGLAIVLTLCILYYISNGASSTKNSPFYTRTVQALQEKQDKLDAQAHLDAVAEEQRRLERVRKEHDAAVKNAVPEEMAGGKQKQQPIVQDVGGAGAEQDGDKSVAGRKMMKGDKIMYERPEGGKDDGNDGVAKVGNVAPKSSHTALSEEESEDEHKVETALNEILKKGPIIIFSKSYCPFSKKAKHILLDLYDISPPPYVVELDQHELGPGLQRKLEKTTGRRTVPNVLINGKSIGGGDDVEELHKTEKVAEKILGMGGKRIVKVERVEGASVEHNDVRKRAFKA